MKNILFTLLLLIVYITQSTAQDKPFIVGPSEVCLGCETYQLLEAGPNQGQLEALYIVNNFNQTDTLCTSIQAGGSFNNFYACFNCEGQYTIHAILALPNGEVRADSLIVNVFSRPTISIEPSDSLSCGARVGNGECQKVCPGFTETYTVIGNIFSNVEWSVTNAQSYTTQGNQVTVTWGESGFGYINAFVQGFGQTCFGEAGYCVEVKNDFDANFTLPGNQFCANESFSPNPENLEGTRYEWDFGNGETSNDIVPVISYDEAGTYTINLKVYNECGCFGTFSKEVTIKSLYLPQIDCKSTICENTKMSYSTTASCGKFYWKIVGDGTLVEGGGINDKSITIDWGTGPVGYIELEVADCTYDQCPKKAVFEIPIVSDLATINGPTVACRSNTSMYAIQKYASTSYNWVVQGGSITAGQGSHAVLVEWGNGATGQVQVIYENCYLKCGGEATLNVNLADSYTLQSNNNPVCIGDVFTATALNNFSQTVTIDKWKIIAPNGSILKDGNNSAQIQLEVPDDIDYFTVVASSYTLCDGEQSLKIDVLEKSKAPTGIEGEFAICKNTFYTYKAQSTLPKSEFYWDVWDGGTKTSHTGPVLGYQWLSDGPYKLELRQIDLSKQLCLSNAYVQGVEKINQVELTGDVSSCMYDSYNIKASLFVGLSYQWSVAPADAATFITNDSNAVNLLWSKPGTHTIQLTNCAGSFTKQVEVHSLPEPVVDHSPVACEGSPSVVKVVPSYVQAFWKDVDKNLIASGNEVMIAPGTYTVDVVDANGCKSLENFTIQSYPKPNVYLSSPDEEAICKSIPGWTYPELVVNTAEGGYQYQWYLNGTDLGITTPTYASQSTGNYQVVVTDLHQCTNQSNILVVYDKCDPNDPGNGGGGGGGGGNPCTNTTGTVGYTFSMVDCNTFDFTSTATDVIGNGYYWNFGDIGSLDNYLTGTNVSHNFSNAGYYSVYHQTDVKDNVTGTTCQIFNKQKLPVPLAADFENGLACEGAEIKFYDRTTFIPGVTITSWEWNFGDPASGADNTASTAEASHIYQSEGTYVVTLKVSNGSCTDEIQKTIQLHPKPNATITSLGAVCEKQASPLELTPNADIVKASWNFGDPLSGANNEYEGLDAYHQYDSPSTFSMIVKAETIYGCKADLSGSVLIHANTLTGDITSSLGDRFCEGLTTTLQAPAGGISWQWSNQSTTESVTSSETGLFAVEIKDNFGCHFTTDNIFIEVLPLPKSYLKSTMTLGDEVKLAFGNNVSFCAGTDYKLEVINKAGWSYQWSNFSTNTSIEFKENLNNQLAPGLYNYFVDIKEIATGCIQREGPIQITVNGLPSPPQIAGTTSGILCEGTTHTIKVVNPSSTLNYKWSNGKKTTQIEASNASDYIVTATDVNGCSSISNVVTVVNGPDTELVPYGCFERCAPDTLCYPAIADVATYQWFKNGVVVSPAEGGNSAYPVWNMDGSYQLQLTGTNGCITTSAPLDLTLIQPVGTISGKVYSDVNANGTIDNADTLLNGVIISTQGFADTTQLGTYTLVNVPAGQNIIAVDTHSLPAGAKILTNNLQAILSGCDDETSLDILIGIDCISQSKTFNYLVCPGEEILIEGHIIKEDSLLTIITPETGGCADTAKYLVEYRLPIMASFTSQPACPGQANGSLTLATQTTENFIVLINGNDSPDNTTSWSNLSSGTYEVELKDSYGCITGYTTQIAEKAKPEFIVSSENLTCVKTKVEASVILLNYAQNEVTINWSNSATGLSTEVTNAGSLKVTINNGCGDVFKEVTIEQEKAKHETKKFIVCNGNAIDLLNQSFDNDTSFFLLKEAPNGCTDTTTYSLNFSPDYDIDYEVEGSCPGIGNGSVTLLDINTSAFTIYLNDQPVVTNGAKIEQLYFGNYKVQLKDEIGCFENIDVNIPEKENLEFTLLDEDISCFKGKAVIGIEPQNYAVEDLQFNWGGNGSTATLETSQTGSYELSVSTGCETLEFTYEVTTTDKLPSFDLPNILDASSQGVNPVIDLQKTPFAGSEILHFNIYDRMGRLVHEAPIDQLTWRGYFGSAPLASGVYIYTLEANVDVCGTIEKIRKAGTLTLLR